MLRAPLLNTKANTTLFHVLSGLIIGFLFLIFFIKILIPIIFPEKDYEGSFENFVSEIELISNPKAEIGERLSPVLLLDKDLSVIAFMPKLSNRNGRLGDGNLHAIRSERFENPENYHFERPTTCQEDKTCICLCSKLIKKEFSEAESLTQKDLQIDTNNDKLYNPYDKVLPAKYFKPENFLYNPKESQEILLECKSITCQETEAKLYTPLKDTYFRDASYDTMRMFENGFLLTRDNTFYYTTLSERTIVHIVKLPNKELLITTQLDNSLKEITNYLKVEQRTTGVMVVQADVYSAMEMELRSAYRSTADGHIISKQTKPDEELVELMTTFYNSLSSDEKNNYYFDEETGNLYLAETATAYDFLPESLKEHYEENPGGVYYMGEKDAEGNYPREVIIGARYTYENLPTELEIAYYLKEGVHFAFTFD